MHHLGKLRDKLKDPDGFFIEVLELHDLSLVGIRLGHLLEEIIFCPIHGVAGFAGELAHDPGVTEIGLELIDQVGICFCEVY